MGQFGYAMAKTAASSLPALLSKARMTLSMSQEELGNRVIASRKTVGRWESGTVDPGRGTLAEIVKMVHAVDADLAAALAVAGGETLESLRVVVPAAPVDDHANDLLVDAIVCAAADAGDATPRAMRPALMAAFECAMAAGLDVKAVVRGLARRMGKKAR
jgi:DNA-binding XRE family transcriptional regulator